jgi:hypothetical protein
MNADAFRKWIAVAGAASVIGLAWCHRHSYRVEHVGDYPIIYRINYWNGDVDFTSMRINTRDAWLPLGRQSAESRKSSENTSTGTISENVEVPPYGVFGFPPGLDELTIKSIAQAIHETSLPKQTIFDIVADEANTFP